MTVIYAILTLAAVILLVYFEIIISDWNKKRRIENDIWWIVQHSSLQFNDFFYKNTYFSVNAIHERLLDPYDDKVTNVAMRVNAYQVYINDTLVLVMNVVDTCGADYRFIKYTSDYDSFEVNKIIHMAAKLYRKDLYKKTQSKTKSFFK